MKLAHFIGLLLVASLALLTAAVLQRQGQQAIEQQAFIRDFDFSKIEQVTLQDQHHKVEMIKGQGHWQVLQAHSYKADTQLLSKLLQQLKHAQVQELKTNDPSNYHRLGLAEVTEPNSEAILLRLTSAGQVIEILLGAKAKFGEGQYAKLLAERQTVLLDTSLSITTKPTAWLNKDILAINFDSVTSLHWLSAKETDFAIAKSAQEQIFSLQQPTSITNVKYPSVFSGLVRNTLQLQLKQVLPLSAFIEQQLQPQFTITLTFNSQDVEQQTTLAFYQHKGSYWLTVEGKLWAYRIDEFSFKQLAKPLDEYMQD